MRNSNRNKTCEFKYTRKGKTVKILDVEFMGADSRCLTVLHDKTFLHWDIDEVHDFQFIDTDTPEQSEICKHDKEFGIYYLSKTGARKTLTRCHVCGAMKFDDNEWIYPTATPEQSEPIEIDRELIARNVCKKCHHGNLSKSTAYPGGVYCVNKFNDGCYRCADYEFKYFKSVIPEIDYELCEHEEQICIGEALGKNKYAVQWCINCGAYRYTGTGWIFPHNALTKKQVGVKGEKHVNRCIKCKRIIDADAYANKDIYGSSHCICWDNYHEKSED